MKFIIASILLFSSVSFAGNTYKLKCENNDLYTDLGSAKISLNTVITVNAENDYFIEGGNFYFYIEDSWTDQNTEIEKVSNYLKYNPRKYKKHAKFSRIGKSFMGTADFIVPHDALINGEKSFEGVFILSWVEDHWGGTVIANCKLTQ